MTDEKSKPDREAEDRMIEEADEESFPASDPPARTGLGGAGAPNHGAAKAGPREGSPWRRIPRGVRMVVILVGVLLVAWLISMVGG